MIEREKIEADDLVTEIWTNARRDRAALEKFQRELDRFIEENEGSSAAALADSYARISDSLVRVNAHLVELTKIVARRDLPSVSKKEEAVEKIFSEIEDDVSAPGRLKGQFS